LDTGKKEKRHILRILKERRRAYSSRYQKKKKRKRERFLLGERRKGKIERRGILAWGEKGVRHHGKTLGKKSAALVNLRTEGKEAWPVFPPELNKGKKGYHPSTAGRKDTGFPFRRETGSLPFQVLLWGRGG